MIESDKPFLIHIIFKRSNVFNLANQEIQEMIERTSDESGSDSDFDESTVLEIEADVDDIAEYRNVLQSISERACLITLHSNFEIFQKGHPAVEIMLDRRIFER